MHIVKAADIPPGRNTGMGRVMYETADAMRRMGHQVDLLLGPDVLPYGAERLPRHLAFPRAIAKVLQAKIAAGAAYDVVELHEPAASSYCRLRRRDPSLPPCVVMSQGLEERQWELRKQLDALHGRKTSLKSLISVPLTRLPSVREGLRSAQQVMILNRDDARFLKERMQLPDERVTQTANGVSTFFLEAGKDGTPPSSDTKRLLFVGSWLERKGTAPLAAAFAALVERDPAYRLSLVGTGVGEAEVLSSFPAAVRDKIRVLVRVDDAELLEEYRTHGLFVFPTFHEPWGIVLLEAAVLGMPIITTNVGGPAAMFEHGVSAHMVPPADPKAIVDAVLQLESDPEYRARLSANGRLRAQQMTWDAAARTHLLAYERALAVSRGVPVPTQNVVSAQS